jgi:hypothetical protein
VIVSTVDRTHAWGHQLGKAITKSIQFLAYVSVDPPSLLSDHSPIVVTFDIVRTLPQFLIALFNVNAVSKDLRQLRLIAGSPNAVGIV